MDNFKIETTKDYKYIISILLVEIFLFALGFLLYVILFDKFDWFGFSIFVLGLILTLLVTIFLVVLSNQLYIETNDNKITLRYIMVKKTYNINDLQFKAVIDTSTKSFNYQLFIYKDRTCIYQISNFYYKDVNQRSESYYNLLKDKFDFIELKKG